MGTGSLIPKIIYEDAHLWVLSKPAGLLSQGDVSGEENLVDWLRRHVGRHYVGLIHRLDRNTSGIMLVAKRTKSAARLTEALQKGEVKRTYLGWAAGNLQKKEQWRHCLLKDEKTNQVSVVRKGSAHSKEAVLFASPQGHKKFKECDLTLIEYVLETGRSHQIRVQSAAAGFPLLGDPKYGRIPEALRTLFSRPALHSYRLEFLHPMSQESMAYSADLPDDFLAIQQL